MEEKHRVKEKYTFIDL